MKPVPRRNINWVPKRSYRHYGTDTPRRDLRQSGQSLLGQQRARIRLDIQEIRPQASRYSSMGGRSE